MSYQDHIYVVILCGGGGTRVWPLSVSKKPKQFLNFFSDQTLFQETMERALKLVPIERVIIVTNAIYREEIIKQISQLPKENIIAEPMKRNTAMAMGVAAAFVAKRDADGVLINLASDHVITNLPVYYKTLKTAAQIAYNEHALVSVGIQPTFPHPGLGYIQLGDTLRVMDGLTISKVAGFREKPDVDTAKTYVESGQYLWNANNYVWRCDDILSEFDTLSPQIAQCIRELETHLGTVTETEGMKTVYQKTPEEPIDTAISEKTKKLVVLPGTFGWYDIGGWQVVYDLGNKDTAGNVIVKSREAKVAAPVVAIESQNNLIYTNGQPVAVVGLSNVVVVDTGQGLLICDREKSNDVKKVVETLKRQGYDQYL